MIKEDNIVRVSRDYRDPKAVSRYLEATIRKFNSEIYNRYYCVKLTFHKKALGYVDYIIKLLNNAFKVQLKECKPLTDGFDTGRGIIPTDCWEITLTKLQILEDDEPKDAEEEYNEMTKKLDIVRNS